MLAESFPARYAAIKREIARMIDEAPDRGPLAPGHYWASARYWMDTMFKQDAAWVATHFRWHVRESLSDGYPGDYSKEPPDVLARCGERYDRYTAELPSALHLEEPAFPRAWGFDWKGRRISYAITRLQRCFANLHSAGAFAREPRVIFEIGAGYGLLALSLLNRVPRCRYIIIDVPPILALSATMLAIQRPDLRQGFAADADADIILLPHYALPELAAVGPRIDLALNTLSFAEMAEENVDAYGAFLAGHLDGVLYSENMRRHPHNYAMRNKVATILGKHLPLYPDDATYDPLERKLNYMWQQYVHFGGKATPAKIIGENFTLDGELRF